MAGRTVISWSNCQTHHTIQLIINSKYYSIFLKKDNLLFVSNGFTSRSIEIKKPKNIKPSTFFYLCSTISSLSLVSHLQDKQNNCSQNYYHKSIAVFFWRRHFFSTFPLFLQSVSCYTSCSKVFNWCRKWFGFSSQHSANTMKPTVHNLVNSGLCNFHDNEIMLSLSHVFMCFILKCL